MSTFCSIDNQGEIFLEINLAFFDGWIFILKNPRISFLPDATAHENYNFHSKWNSQFSSYVTYCSVWL
jgi:hypothetical protein